MSETAATYTITVRLSEEDNAILESLAEASGLTPTEYMEGWVPEWTERAIDEWRQRLAERLPLQRAD